MNNFEKNIETNHIIIEILRMSEYCEDVIENIVIHDKQAILKLIEFATNHYSKDFGFQPIMEQDNIDYLTCVFSQDKNNELSKLAMELNLEGLILLIAKYPNDYLGFNFPLKKGM